LHVSLGPGWVSERRPIRVISPVACRPASINTSIMLIALASLLRGGRYVYGESAGLAGPPGEGTAADSASPASRR
jgi:hypothetical protein